MENTAGRSNSRLFIAYKIKQSEQKDILMKLP